MSTYYYSNSTVGLPPDLPPSLPGTQPPSMPPSLPPSIPGTPGYHGTAPPTPPNFDSVMMMGGSGGYDVGTVTPHRTIPLPQPISPRATTDEEDEVLRHEREQERIVRELQAHHQQQLALEEAEERRQQEQEWIRQQQWQQQHHQQQQHADDVRMKEEELIQEQQRSAQMDTQLQQLLAQQHHQQSQPELTLAQMMAMEKQRPPSPPQKQPAPHQLSQPLQPSTSHSQQQPLHSDQDDEKYTQLMDQLAKQAQLEHDAAYRQNYRSQTQAAGATQNHQREPIPTQIDATNPVLAMADPTSASSIISALTLRVAQLESTLAARDTEIHQLRFAAKTNDLKLNALEAANNGVLNANIIAASDTNSLAIGSLGAQLLAQVSPSTFSDRISLSDVIQLEHHHQILIALTIQFDLALTAGAKEAELLKTHVEKLEDELKNSALHADTLAIDLENLQARNSELQSTILDTRREKAEIDLKLHDAILDLERYEHEYHKMQAENAAIVMKFNQYDQQQHTLAQTLASTQRLLDDMTQKRDEEIFLKNSFQMKYTTLEAEYEKVERIWEEYQKQIIPTNGMNDDSIHEEKSQEAQFSPASPQQQFTFQSPMKPAFTPATGNLQQSPLTPSKNVNYVPNVQLLAHQTSPNVWLQQHELQHLFHKNEKRKLKTEVKELNHQVELWKERYETLQKLHYAMVDQQAALGLTSQPNTARGDGTSHDEYSLPPSVETLPPCPAPPLPPSPMTQRSSGAPTTRTARATLDTKVIGPTSAEVEAIRSEVKRLIYFLVKRKNDKQTTPEVADTFQAPLLPPMPTNLPNSAKPSWICLEESYTTLSSELALKRQEVNNLNSMLNLLMDPVYKMDWSVDGMKASAATGVGDASSNPSSNNPQSAIMLEGLFEDLKYKETELNHLREQLSLALTSEQNTLTSTEKELQEMREDTERQLSAMKSECDHRLALVQESSQREMKILQEATGKRLAEMIDTNSKALKEAQLANETHLKELRERCQYWEAQVYQRVTELTQAHQKELALAKERDETERKRYEKDVLGFLEDVESKHASELAQSREGIKEQLQSLISSHDQEKAQMEAKHLAELAPLKEELIHFKQLYSTEIKELQAKIRPSRVIASGAQANDIVRVRFHGTIGSTATPNANSTGPVVPVFTSPSLSLLTPPDASSAPGPASGLPTGHVELDATVAQLATTTAALAEQEALVTALRQELSALGADYLTIQLKYEEMEGALARTKELNMKQLDVHTKREHDLQLALQHATDSYVLLDHFHSHFIELLRQEMHQMTSSTNEWKAFGSAILVYQMTLEKQLETIPKMDPAVTGVTASTIKLESFDHLQLKQEVEAKRVELQKDLDFLAQQQKDFQLYLTQQQTSLESRLIDIQSAEELILQKDRELLYECALLNAKIEEYNKKASELNQRTEDLKQKRIEMKEERAIWMKYKRGLMTIAESKGLPNGPSATTSSSGPLTDATSSSQPHTLSLQEELLLIDHDASASFDSPPISPRASNDFASTDSTLTTSREDAFQIPLLPLEPIHNSKETRTAAMNLHAATATQNVPQVNPPTAKTSVNTSTSTGTDTQSS